MTKDVNKTDTFNDRLITLRSVYDKANIKYFILPCKDKFGQYPSCIKKVDSNNNMIMSERERNDFSEGKLALFPENHIFTIVSGKTYNLDNIWDSAEWESIKNCPLIAKSRDARDANGNYLIDGATPNPSKITKSGEAELYVDIPGLETQKRVSKKKLVFKAQQFIYDDPQGADGLLKIAKLLGKNMSNQSNADVVDYLIRVAEHDPNKIINLYTGGDTALRLMFIDAKDKKVIYIKDKLYTYGDNIVLGMTDDAVINWMKDSRNLKVLSLIRKDTYPDFYPDDVKTTQK